MPPKMTNEIITAAIEGFESQKLRIDQQIAELRSMLSGVSTQPAEASVAAPGKRKKFSAAARQRMRDAQKKRWAKIKGESSETTESAPAPAKKRRKMSAAGRRAIGEATRKRWADLRAAKEQKEAKPRKKAGRKKAAKTATAAAA